MKKHILKALRHIAMSMPVKWPNDKDQNQIVTWKANYRKLKKSYRMGLLDNDTLLDRLRKLTTK